MLETGERILSAHTLYYWGDENDAQLHTTTFIYSYLLKYLRLATHNQTYNYNIKTIVQRLLWCLCCYIKKTASQARFNLTDLSYIGTACALEGYYAV